MLVAIIAWPWVYVCFCAESMENGSQLLIEHLRCLLICIFIFLLIFPRPLFLSVRFPFAP